MAVLSVFKRIYPNGQAVILDQDPNQHGKHIAGFEVLGSDDLAEDFYQKGYTHFIISVGMIEPDDLRETLYQKMIKIGVTPLTLIDPSVIKTDDVKIGQGTIVMMGCLINAGAVIGDNVILNSKSIVEHGSTVHDHCHIAPGAILCGDVEVGGTSFIGAGVVVVQSTNLPDRSFLVSKKSISVPFKKDNK